MRPVRRPPGAADPAGAADLAGASRARARLVAAAAVVYARSGARGTTARRVAEAAGVDEGAVARHFGSKQALLGAAVEAALAGLVVPLPAAPADPAGELAGWCAAQTAALRRVRGVLRRCTLDAGEGDPALAAVAARAFAAVAAELRAYARRLRDAGHPGARGDLWTRTALLTASLFTDALWRAEGFGCGAAPESYAPARLAAAFLDPGHAGPAPNARA